MAVKFYAETHSYVSTTEEQIAWISCTSLLSNFKAGFDAKAQSESSAKKKTGKYVGMTPEQIQDAWKAESKRSTDLGTWYHNQREADLTSCLTVEHEGTVLPVHKGIEIDGIKYAGEQKLTPGLYPEHFVFLRSAGICGQSDLVKVVGDTVHIEDYKTNKKIETVGFKSWDGSTKRMKAPLAHLDDCNLNVYSLQLSLYMYMILKHNPRLKAGSLIIRHVTFEAEGQDKFGNPIYKTDAQGNFIVKEVIPYEVPYRKLECISIINWLKDNRSKLKPKH